jgi:hypothetical protein
MGSFRGAKFLKRMLSLFFRRFFFQSFGQKNLVRVNNDFLKFYAEHTHQELVRKLSIRARHWCAC